MIIIHESGHLIASLLLKVKVEAFSIGFGRPLFKKIFKGIDFRITPFLLGGYTKIRGEIDYSTNGLLVQPYYKKFIIIIAGVLMNLIATAIVYLIAYKSILTGIKVDYLFWTYTFTKDYYAIPLLLEIFKVNGFVLLFTVMNGFGALLNLLPIPALDGGYLWLYLLKRFFNKKDFISFLKIMNVVGWGFLIILQIILVYIYLVI